ncbi:MAG: hypothetical protein ACRCW6_01020 [Mycoplasmoidaceae bacterium]
MGAYLIDVVLNTHYGNQSDCWILGAYLIDVVLNLKKSIAKNCEILGAYLIDVVLNKKVRKINKWTFWERT